MINQATFENDSAAGLFVGGGASSATRNRFWVLTEIAFLGDTLVIVMALAFSSWLRFGTALGHYGTSVGGGAIHWTDYAGHIVYGTILLTLLLVRRRLYAISGALRLRHVAAIIVKSVVIWALAYIGLTALVRVDQDVSRLYVLLSSVTLLVALGGWRWILHKIMSRAVASGHLRQRILFVGWSEQAASLVKVVSASRDHAFEVAGCVPSPQGRYLQNPPARLRKLGDYGNLKELLGRHSVDVVMVADMEMANGEMVGLANLCEKEMVEFKVIPSCFQILVSGLNLETVSGVPVLALSRLPLDNPLNLVLKSVVDVVGGLVGLVMSAPFIALFGLLVYMESPGPIFYRQRRLGRYGKHFDIIKIRSMRLDAEAGGKVGWSTKEDPRRLRVGTFMRRWNIDELPQFWNVLRGDMSLVGPRPERPELIVDFKEVIPHYNARHNIKPGITGWAQVKGFRGDTDLGERIRCDLYYIEKWSVIMDLQIMAMTFLGRKNAC